MLWGTDFRAGFHRSGTVPRWTGGAAPAVTANGLGSDRFLPLRREVRPVKSGQRLRFPDQDRAELCAPLLNRLGVRAAPGPSGGRLNRPRTVRSPAGGVSAIIAARLVPWVVWPGFRRGL